MPLIHIHADDQGVSHYLSSIGYRRGAAFAKAWCGTASEITGVTLPFVTCLACARIYDLSEGWTGCEVSVDIDSQ